MTSFKLIFRNLRKNISDYLIYFITLVFAVSLFYAFNSLTSQSAFQDLSMVKKLLFQQLGIYITALSVVIAIILAFMILYANQFLLKRRKRELGIYTMLGMEKKKISRIFVGETLLTGILALIVGLIVGLILSQGLSLFSMRMFATPLERYRFVFSVGAFNKTLICFILIFVLVMLFNGITVTRVKLIDLFNANRKNEKIGSRNRFLTYLLFGISLVSLGIVVILISKNGLLPSRTNLFFQYSAVLACVGTILLFYAGAMVLLNLTMGRKNFYLKQLNTFLIRQFASKVHSNYLLLAIGCGLLTVSICANSVGVGMAMEMNELAHQDAPFELDILSTRLDIDGDVDIAKDLKQFGLDITEYVSDMAQLSMYSSDITYGDLFEGQQVELWDIDRNLPKSSVTIVSISDFNKAMKLQGKKEYSLPENGFLLNCNYKGTVKLMKKAFQAQLVLKVGDTELTQAGKSILTECYFMNSIGSNDHGTIIIPDDVANKLEKKYNFLLAQYKDGADTGELLNLLLPIGLDENHGYRYSDRSMMYDMYFGSSAMIAFICSYIGLVFLMVCAALLALKQLTETTDNIQRFGLLRKLGADEKQLNQTLFRQISIFFATPLMVACIYAVFVTSQVVELVNHTMNMQLTSSAGFTICVFLIVYGIYYLSTYISCKKIIREKHR